MESQNYWNQNLDMDNLSRRGGDRPSNLEEAARFAATPDFEWLKKRLGPGEGRRLVELGGGIGMHAVLWARAGYRVVVCDLALERMRAMRRLAEAAGVGDRICCVVGRAESLPFCEASVDVVFTKSVLIHTELRFAAREMQRVLKPGGQGAFIEPLNRNPLIRLYRFLLAPRIWRRITRYFDAESRAVLREVFGRVFWKPFYLTATAAFFWQYGRRDLRRFERSLRRGLRRDRRWMEKRPALADWCWFAAILVQKRNTPPQ